MGSLIFSAKLTLTMEMVPAIQRLYDLDRKSPNDKKENQKQKGT